jgi:hypothetical protein
MTSVDRRSFLAAMGAGAAWLAAGRAWSADLAAVYREIERRHDESIARLQAWIRQPSIAAENNGVEDGSG